MKKGIEQLKESRKILQEGTSNIKTIKIYYFIAKKYII